MDKPYKLRILFFDFNIPYLLKNSDVFVGGATVRLYAFCKGLIHRGHSVGVLTWKGTKEFVGSDPGFGMIESYHKEYGLKYLRWIYYRIPRLFFSIKNYKSDFLIQRCAGFDTGIIAIISKILRIPFVYLVANDIDVDERLSTVLSHRSRIFYNIGLKQASIIICQNDYQKKCLVKRFPAKVIRIIKNPFHTGIKTDPLLNNERQYFAWIGSFTYQKNLAAFYRIAANNKKYKFKIAGKSNTALDPETSNAINNLSALDNVEFIGNIKRDEVFSFLSGSYALINTSRYEGFSNTFLEAFSVATPVISLIVNPDDIFNQYSIGYLVNEENIHEVLLKCKELDHNKSKDYFEEYLVLHHDYKVNAEIFADTLLAYRNSLNTYNSY